MFHIPNVYKDRLINENPRSILLFALALFIYLYFYYFAKRKVLFEISYVTTFWITYSLFLFKWKPWPRLTQTQQYTDRETINFTNFTAYAVTYNENIPVCINQRYTSLNKTLHIILYNSNIAFNNSRGNNNIPILTITKDLSE
jgi:hypothetical protein